jgi:integrase/recombinase XerD
VTFDHHRHADRWLRRVEGKGSKRTYDARKRDLKKYQQWCDSEGVDLIDLSPIELTDYFLDMSRDGYPPTTISSRWDSVRLFYRFLVQAEVIDESPFENIERKEYSTILRGTKKKQETKEEITYLSPAQIDQLCEYAPSPADRNQLIFRLMFQTGLRRGETTDIELDDIDRDRREINIHSDKVHRNRTVYYQPSLDLALDLWINDGQRSRYMSHVDSPYLFVSRQSPQLGTSSLNEIVVEAAWDTPDIDQEVLYVDMSGKERKKYTCHSLRHSHAIESIKSGIDIERVRRHMGHASLEMTMRYLRFVKEDTRSAYQRFGSRLPDEQGQPPIEATAGQSRRF